MKTSIADHFEALSTLIKECKLTLNGGIISGSLKASASVRETLEKLEEDGAPIITIRIERDQNKPNSLPKLKNNETFNIEITLLRTTGHFFGRDLDDLLSEADGRYCWKRPHNIYLIKEKFSSGKGKEAPKAIDAYFELLDFIKHLKDEVADVHDDNELTLVRSAGKLRLPIKYSATTLKENADKIIESLSFAHKYISGNDRREDKNLHLKIALIGALSSQPTEDCFDFMLSNLDRITDNFLHSYEVFINSYSFESDYERLLAENRDFRSQLNGAIASVQGRAIAIPFGTIVPALMIKSRSAQDAGLEGVFFAAATFICAVIGLMIFSQFFDLFRIKQEFQAKKQRMKDEIPTLARRLSTEYQRLNLYYCINVVLLAVIMAGLVISYFVPLAVYFELDIAFSSKLTGFIFRMFGNLSQLIT